ncbi:DUF6931 family protein [Loktanella agnita]|uniref:DUF6931 family protein n=1 Tax=Loktanella agnita TaxID=287097 RepID=UPI0039889C7A
MSPNDATPLDEEKTRPPAVATRYETLADLYAAIPQLADVTQQRPRAGDEALPYLMRLRQSTTPEEAVTFTAFAIQPKLAIWWGHECLRVMPDALTAVDRQMMELVAGWIGRPDTAMRHHVAREALWASAKSPGVHLALAVAWSGGSLAPNDPAPVHPSRAPRAINTAILSCLARAELSRRPIFLARFIDMAESLFKVY